MAVTTLKTVNTHNISRCRLLVAIMVLVGTASLYPWWFVVHEECQQGIRTSKTHRVFHHSLDAMLISEAKMSLGGLLSDSHGSIFGTNFSTKAWVHTKGFPYSLLPCTLQKTRLSEFRASHNFRPLRISVLGGSSSAHSSTNCELDQGDFGGRYSNILQRTLSLDFANLSSNLITKLFEVDNLAHGATDSAWNSLVLDELLDVKQTDILVWEFATNDALGGSTGATPRNQPHLAKLLNLWIWRVICIFDKAGRSVPPILMVYLWDSAAIQEDGSLGQSAFRNQREVIEHYRNQGLSIGVVNVGGVIKGIEGATDPKKRWWLDDAHHPSCQGQHLIAGMLRQLIYSDIVSCLNSTWAEPTTNSFVPMMDNGDIDAVYSYLIQNSVSIGSLMEWKPQSGASRLQITDGDQVRATEADHGAKALLTREDRKFSYVLPPCPRTTDFTIVEPKLEWLGLGYGGGSYLHHDYTGRVRVQINGVVVNNTETAERNKLFRLDEIRFVKAWIHVPQVVGRSELFSLSVCKDVDVRSRCPYASANTVADACFIWVSRQQSRSDNVNTTASSSESSSLNITIDSCPLWGFQNVHEGEGICMEWYQSPEGQALAAKYGAWTGSWSRSDFGDPQLNWNIGVINDTRSHERS